MSDQLDPLAQFSGALAARVEAANPSLHPYLSHGRHLTGMVWRPDIGVTSRAVVARPRRI